ncbi:hypothetical protein BEWA_010510 [Theileria equi strain WA]|uniref:AP2/ERF domain-containing protein n=1 Tax=Theileria equi strain WA TaxID=1537102 RepID=L0B3D5_THEEQ|nr:hypothetical protein BEWA_010510 [Theileria equi strain WA]AFZ81634.1 hypothetical protein BEWA_010510 [Theileria equi strain WA]|eukprot:XP_004831300.1 hypothetical protein BEWA_010510 [Theileria equi strain WA]
MSDSAHSVLKYPGNKLASHDNLLYNSMAEAEATYEYNSLDQEYGSTSDVPNRIDGANLDNVDYAHQDGAKGIYDQNSFAPTETGQILNEQASWQPSYLQMPDETLRHNGDVRDQDHRMMSYGRTQPYEMPSGMVPGYAADPVHGPVMHQKMIEMGQQDVMPGMHMSMDVNVVQDPPRRMISKGRKNKDEANELVRRAKLLPKVMGVRYDANHQYWVATWYQNRKRMDRYFSVGRFGFEEARLLAIDCRKTAGKSLQGKSYDRPSYNKDGHSKSRNSYDIDQGIDKHGDYYASGEDVSKKSKDFNRLNVSKVALNYILSDLCNNCLPTILENNHMPGELYIHCYNKISDHLQLIITANQSEEIEKYLHLFQLCIQNRVLPSALQVQEQRAMITTLCQM